MSDAQRDSGEVSALAEAALREPERTSSGPVRIAIRCAGRTAVGQVRDHNEDNFVIANLATGRISPRDQVCEDEVGERGLIFAVCDGMGGAAAGEVASQMAVDILVEAMRRGGLPKNRDALARRLVGAVEEAGRRIFDSAQKERSRRGMGTTATVAVLVDKVMFIAEVGDSRAYLLRRGQLKQLTKDQSLVNQLIEAGHLTEDEAEAFEHSNIILQALGTSETVQVDLTFVELRRGDRLMLCSDGLSGLVHADALRSTLDELKDPADCCGKLIEYAETAGGHDNITVVVADFDGEGLTAPIETDSFGYLQYPLPLSDDEANAFADEDTGGGPVDAHDGADEDIAEPEIDDEIDEPGESLLPLSGDGGDTRANALWVLGGVLALVAAVVVWFTLEPKALDDEPVPPGPVAEPAPESDPAGAAAVAPDGQEVEVHIHTDVEGATLLVNGDAKGALSPAQSRSLKLRPGAYRFEAHTGGSSSAVAVVTVRGDMPMDVFLQLPKGASENTDAAGSAKGATDPSPAPSERKPKGEAGSAKASAAQAREAEPRAATQAKPASTQPSEGETSAAKPASTSEPRIRIRPRDESTKSGAEVSAGGDRAAAQPTAPKPAEIPDNPF